DRLDVAFRECGRSPELLVQREEADDDRADHDREQPESEDQLSDRMRRAARTLDGSGGHDTSLETRPVRHLLAGRVVTDRCADARARRGNQPAAYIASGASRRLGAAPI